MSLAQAHKYSMHAVDEDEAYQRASGANSSRGGVELESLTALTRRRARERREANRLEWAAFYWSMAACHTRLAKENMHKAAGLEGAESTNGKA